MHCNACIVKVVPHGRGPSVDPEIGRQRTESLAKDQEARHKVGKQPICVLINLIQNHFLFKVWNSLVLCLLERFELAADKELQVIEGIRRDPHLSTVSLISKKIVH